MSSADVGPDQAFFEDLLSDHSETLEGPRAGAVRSLSPTSVTRAPSPATNRTRPSRWRPTERRQFVEIENTSIDSYTAGRENPRYSKRDTTEAVTYGRDDTEIPGDAFVDTPFDAELLARWTLTDWGIVETDQGPRRKYAVHDVSHADPVVTEYFDGEITNVTFELYVDTERGVISSANFAIQEERANGTAVSSFVFETSDIGQAQVSAPDWLDEAKEETD